MTIHRFATYLLHEDGRYQTQTVNGVTGIVVDADKQEYTYDEIRDIVHSASYLERSQYGWRVRFMDAGECYKTLFLRADQLDMSNLTTKSDETAMEWVDKLYNKDIRQISLF